MSVMEGISRRRFLAGVAVAGAGVAGYAWWKTGGETSKAKGRVLVVGGGAAGMSIAARLRRRMPEAQIALVEPSGEHHYQPGYTMIAGGVFGAAEVVRKQEGLIPDGVEWLKDRVEEVEPEKRRVRLAGRGWREYDVLVLAPGLEMDFEGLPGVKREELGKGNVHCIYDYAGAQRCWQAIEAFSKTGGRAIFTDTWTKLKCGGAPKKVNLMAEHLCRMAGTRGKADIQYFSAVDHLLDAQPFKRRLEEVYAERGVPVHYKMRVTVVDVERKQVTFTGQDGREQTEGFDLLHVVPPMSAPGFVKRSGLTVNPKTGKTEDWVPADKATLRHAQYKEIFVAGDVAGLPTSKTSAAIRRQAPVVVENVVAALEGRVLEARYDGYTACPVITEYGKVLLAEFDYEKKPAPTMPWLDAGREHAAGWYLKKHVLKPLYFDLMLRGLA